MTPRRFAAAAVTVAAGCALLAGCGGDDELDAYCAELEKVGTPFADVRDGDLSRIDQVMEEITAIERQAPEEIADEWSTFATTIGQLQAAVEEQGLTVAEMMELAQQPEIDAEDQERLAAVDATLADLDLQSVGDASGAISQHADENCDLDLGGPDDADR